MKVDEAAQCVPLFEGASRARACDSTRGCGEMQVTQFGLHVRSPVCIGCGSHFGINMNVDFPTLLRLAADTTLRTTPPGCARGPLWGSAHRRGHTDAHSLQFCDTGYVCAHVHATPWLAWMIAVRWPRPRMLQVSVDDTCCLQAHTPYLFPCGHTGALTMNTRNTMQDDVPLSNRRRYPYAHDIL